MIAILKKKGSILASPILYGLAGSAMIALLIFVINVEWRQIAEQKSITTTLQPITSAGLFCPCGLLAMFYYDTSRRPYL